LLYETVTTQHFVPLDMQKNWWECSSGTVSTQSRNSPYFMETESSLAHPQAPANCPCPEPDQSSPYLPIQLLEDPL